ncbi:MAG: hypothetical protein L6Q98_10545 [Anaerolineae bacterium]|nr:hypothetical protein [Anaerolineae bacterium]NUQ02736.1 hypothetical protein [Anaerolineae bacterium]
MEIDFQEILRIIGPGTGRDIIWSIFLYIIFFIGLITLFSIPDKNMVPTLLMGGVLLFAIIAKLSLATKPPILERKEFGMMVINIGMFVFPLISAGLVRARKNRTGAPAILTAVLAGTYFFLFWLIEQRI